MGHQQSSQPQWRIYCTLETIEKSYRPFPVDLSPTSTVDDLKKQILFEAKNNLKRMQLAIGIGDLQLHRVNVFVPDLVKRTALALDTVLSVVGKPEGILIGSKNLTEIFTDTPDPKTVHIVASFSDSVRAYLNAREKSASTTAAPSTLWMPGPIYNYPTITSTISQRTSTVKALYDRLNFYRFVRVRGTPGCGKSTLARLLLDYIVRMESLVPVFMPTWIEADTDWGTRLAMAGWRFDGSSNVLVVDDAESTHWDTELWNDFFKGLRYGSRHRVILFSGYGSATGQTGDDMPLIDPPPSPMIITCQQRIDLQPIVHDDDFDPVGLLLTREEYMEMIENYRPQVVLANDLVDYIYDITTGHPGAINDLIRLISGHSSYYKLNCTEKGARYSLIDYTRSITIEELWKGLCDGDVFKRGLPTLTQLQESDVAKLFRKVLNGRFVEEKDLDDSEKVVLENSVKNGWIYADRLQFGSIYNPERVIYCFTTGLHQWFIDHYLGSHVERPKIDEVHLLDFVLAVISTFSPRRLATPAEVSDSFAAPLPEARYHHDFYRCSHLHASGSLVTSPEFGTERGRQVEFYVPSRKWGIEVVRPGEAFGDHSGRFSDPDAYGRPIDCVDHVILNFQESTPLTDLPNLPKLFHVVFTEDYERVAILDHRLELVTEMMLVDQ